MSGKLVADAFDKMIDEDIEWLKENAPESYIYRTHIENCLKMVKLYYRRYGLPDE